MLWTEVLGDLFYLRHGTVSQHSVPCITQELVLVLLVLCSSDRAVVVQFDRGQDGERGVADRRNRPVSCPRYSFGFGIGRSAGSPGTLAIGRSSGAGTLKKRSDAPGILGACCHRACRPTHASGACLRGGAHHQAEQGVGRCAALRRAPGGLFASPFGT